MKTIGELIKQVFKERGWDDRVTFYEVNSVWNEFVGDKISQNTRLVKFEGGVLWIKVNSSVLKQELLYMRSDIVLAINNKLGKAVIRKIVIE